MLTIRPQQMDALSKAQAKAFEDRMVAHIQEFFPDHYAAMKEAGTRELIRHGVQRAATYGIVAERDVCMYIDMMLAFGPDYDKDGQVPWAGRILRDRGYASPSERMDAVREAGVAQLRREGATT